MTLIKKLIDKFKRPYDRDGYQITGEFKDPADGDRQILDQLVAGGSDLARPRHVLHYLYFAADSDAEKAASDLRKATYTAEVRVSTSDDSEYPYLVVAERNGIVNEEIVKEERTLMIDITARYSGDYDGWEAQEG